VFYHFYHFYNIPQKNLNLSKSQSVATIPEKKRCQLLPPTPTSILDQRPPPPHRPFRSHLWLTTMNTRCYLLLLLQLAVPGELEMIFGI
jgi:hypothetical protein